jgi:dTDP-4-amino-4,6-dideoxygalactose transaminase
MSPVGKLASSPTGFRRPRFFYESAREGFQDFLSQYCDSPRDGVLLPAFVGWSPREGSGVYDPVQNLGLKCDFYDLQDDLSVDVDQLDGLAASGAFSVIVVIHYFGKTEPKIDQIHAIAQRHGLALVEDLAHGFFTAMRGGPAGRHGDVNLFSLHKMLPMRSGGMVSYGNPRLVGKQRSTRPDLAAEILSYDFSSIAACRRQNFEGLTQRLLALPQNGDLFRLMWPELADTDVPQTLPLYIEGSRRDEIYTRLNADGIGVVSLYHTLVSEVRQSHERMLRLSEHITNLPCHQDMTESDLSTVVNSFRRTLESL